MAGASSPTAITIVLVHGGFVDGSGWESIYHDLAGYGLGRRAKRIGGKSWACSERLAFRLPEQ
jgi:hypothetical protein